MSFRNVDLPFIHNSFYFFGFVSFAYYENNEHWTWTNLLQKYMCIFLHEMKGSKDKE